MPTAIQVVRPKFKVGTLVKMYLRCIFCNKNGSNLVDKSAERNYCHGFGLGHSIGLYFSIFAFLVIFFF